MTAPDQTVFRRDADNTLPDHDRFAPDLGARLPRAFGAVERERFLAVNRGVAQTHRDVDAATRAGNARQGVR